MEHSLEYFQKTKNKIAKFEQITNSHTRVWSLFLKRRNLCWKKPRHHNIILILKGNERKAPLPIEITQNINHIFSTEDSRNLKSVFHCSDSFEKNQTPNNSSIVVLGFLWKQNGEETKKRVENASPLFSTARKTHHICFFSSWSFPLRHCSYRLSYKCKKKNEIWRFQIVLTWDGEKNIQRWEIFFEIET